MSLLLDDLRKKLQARQVVVVVGAGVSIAATSNAPVASWRGLLESGIARCVELGRVDGEWAASQRATLGLNDASSWLQVADAVTLSLGGLHHGEFGDWLNDTIGELAPTAAGLGLIRALVELEAPITTTNYDGLLEAGSGFDAATWLDGARSQDILRGDEPGIVHLHGYYKDPKSVVLGHSSYEGLLQNPSAQALLRAVGALRSLVLIGFGAGLEDPNFSAFRQYMAEAFSQSHYRHFRLVLESEASELRQQHDVDERIELLAYGTKHSDLEPFLRDLAGSMQRRPIQASSQPPTAPIVLPAKRALFGRDALLEELVTSVTAATPIPVPVVGPPGIGKSALTLACAHDQRVEHRYGTRRFWVRCDGARSAAALAAEIGRVIGVTFTSDPVPGILTELSASPALLILDNAESPWEQDFPGTEELLGHLAGVEGLALICSFRGAQWPAGTWTERIAVPKLPAPPAREVFLSVAGERFSPDPDLDGLLNDLDGMAIAIELLGRLAQPESSLQGLRERWERQRTDLLKASRTPNRYLSVAVSFDLSITNLAPVDKRLLSILALLPDGVRRSALDAVFENGASVAPELRRVGLAYDDGDRLRVLKPIRDHVAANHPADPPDVARAQAHYLGRTLLLGPALGKKGGAAAMLILLADSANLIWAIASALAGDRPAAGLAGTLAFYPVAAMSGLPIDDLLTEATECAETLGDAPKQIELLLARASLARNDLAAAHAYLTTALELSAEHDERQLEATCLLQLGEIATFRDEWDEASRLHDRALTIYREIGDRPGEANTLHELAVSADFRGEFEQSLRYAKEALDIYIEIKHAIGQANSYLHIGNCALRRSDLKDAQRLFDSAEDLYRDIGDRLGVANSLLCLGQVRQELDDSDEAARYYRRSIRLFRRVGGVVGEANATFYLGTIQREQDDDGPAAASFNTAMKLYRRVEDRAGEANVLRQMAVLALARSEHEQARNMVNLALEQSTSAGDLLGIADAHVTFGQIARKEEDAEEAERQFELALTDYSHLDVPLAAAYCHAMLSTVTRGAIRGAHRARARELHHQIGRDDLNERYFGDDG